MNPAVQKLFEHVENPVLVSAALAALAEGPVTAADVPAALLEPLFVLNAAAREMAGDAIVDDPAMLRERLLEEGAALHNITHALLDGATFNSEPRKYPLSAFMNCEEGEVRLCYLPDGARFKQGDRVGQLIYRTPSRAVIEISGGKKEKTFQNHKTGEDVTISSSGMIRTGCSLEAPVRPIYTNVNHEDRVWATNAWKELTGTFKDEPKAPKRKKAAR